MYLRRLELKDAPLMLEWMHDPSVTGGLRTDFSSKKISDAEEFIRRSWEDRENANFAIASDEDEYMGTVSLKHIEEASAEFAITVRAAAMSRGYAWFGMESILEKAFSEFDLECVYWCVSRENTRAVRFYDKHNFQEAETVPEKAVNRYTGTENLKWYAVRKGDLPEKRKTVAGCKVVRIKTVPTEGAGELSFFEGTKDVPFDIKRIYYITGVPEGVRRGFHAHKELKQLLFCPYGKIQLVLENKYGREEIELSDPGVGVVIEELTWREMLWLQKNSVLCVAASDYYKAEDYIRDYEEFQNYIADQGKTR